MSEQKRRPVPPPKRPQPESGGSEKQPKFPSMWVYVAIVLALLVFQVFFMNPETPNRIEYSKFLGYVDKGYVEHVVIRNGNFIVGKYKPEAVERGYVEYNKGRESVWQIDQQRETAYRFTTTMIDGDNIREILDRNNVQYDARIEDNWFGGLLTWILPLGLILVFWMILFRRMNPGQQVLNIGKNKALLYDRQGENKVTFKDVAGLDEAKEEVEEVVEFLKNPEKFTKLGGAIPKGVLLVGPPGTGKTLMAKATAGEADVPFFSLSGSDFVEMFVGVGAARVRDLFKQAKEKAPCIIFIDEIDAIGRSRSKGMAMGSNDERENTLNQLLTEMDGFNTEKGIIIMAATNRPDILDSALLRAGRFDRQILIDKPDLKGRVDILEVHTKKLKMSEQIDLKILASQTPGFAGAELANMCNEAALLAARRNKQIIEMVDFQDAIERVIAGLEKKNKIIAPHEREIVAYHEAGHAIVGWYLEHTDPVMKVSIVPRGLAALGYTLQTPLEDRFLMTKEELSDKICALLGGRVAEEIIFGKISTGAQNDLERITNMAFAMVAVYGMSDELGYLSYLDSQNPDNSFGFNRKYSDETSTRIDQAVKRIVDDCHKRTKALLIKHKNKLEEMAKMLLAKEILTSADLLEMLGDRPTGSYPIKLEEIRAQAREAMNGAANKVDVVVDDSTEVTAAPKTKAKKVEAEQASDEAPKPKRKRAAKSDDVTKEE